MEYLSAAHGVALLGSGGLVLACQRGRLSTQRAGIAAAVLAVVAQLVSKNPLLKFVSMTSCWRAIFGYVREKWPLEVWIESYSEEALEPEMEIIDPHHHLWDARTQPKGWPMPRWFIHMLYLNKLSYIVDMTITEDTPWRKAELNSFGHRQLMFSMPYMGRELDADIRNAHSGGKPGHKVVQTVYLECGWHDTEAEEGLWSVGEAAMAHDVNRQYPNLCNGIVANANLSSPQVEKVLAAYSTMPGVKGIRHSLAHSDNPMILDSGSGPHKAAADDFRKGFALLDKYGLTYDTWMFHEQLADVTDLVKAFPNQVVIIDHVAMPLGRSTYKRSEVFPAWEKGIKALAQASSGNVYVKLSGLAMCNCGFDFDLKEKPPSSKELAEAWGPYFKVVLDAFGVDKCMFASNFPVDKVTCDYTVLWNAFKHFTSNMSAADKRKLYYENAKRVYKL